MCSPNELENKRTNSKQDDGVLDGLDLEVEPDQREYETFEILHQVVECAQTLGILGVVDVDQRTDFGRGEGNVLIPANDLQFLIEEKETEGNGHLNCDCDNVN